MKKTIKRILNTMGYDIARYHHAYHTQARRMQLLKVYDIDTVLDVGANVGQFGNHLREDGYNNNIISFEPLSDAFGQLEENCKNDNRWSCVNIALGNDDGESIINISKNSCSSSLLDMKPEHVHSAPNSVYVDKEKIKVCRLDTVFHEYCKNASNIYMKVDTQGYGMEVLKGAETSLLNIKGIQMEVSLVTLYDNEPLIEEFIEYLRAKKFVPMSIEPGFGDSKSGQLLQADFIFYRSE